MNIDCQHLIGGKCDLTRFVIGEPVTPHESACVACQSLESHRRESVNYAVVVTAAIEMRGRHGIAGYDQVVNRFRTVYQPNQGAGSELERIIYKWLGFFLNTKTDACDCQVMKETMDRNGPNWCRKNINPIVDKLEANHAALGVKVPFVRFIAVAAVKAACNRAEKLRPEKAVLPSPIANMEALIRRPSSADNLVAIE